MGEPLTKSERWLNEVWARFLDALDAAELPERQRARIYNAALEVRAAPKPRHMSSYIERSARRG